MSPLRRMVKNLRSSTSETASSPATRRKITSKLEVKMKRAVLLLMGLFVLAMAVDTQDLAVGSAIENFSLPDLNGNVQTLNRLKGQKGAVVIFLSAQCPMVKAYKDRINQIATDAGGKGINFIGINSNSNESLSWLKSNASGFGYRFPILIDKGNKLADTLDV